MKHNKNMNKDEIKKKNQRIATGILISGFLTSLLINLLLIKRNQGYKITLTNSLERERVLMNVNEVATREIGRLAYTLGKTKVKN